VVATATLHYNGDPGAATVLWGDGTSTSRCAAGQEGPLHSGCLPSPFDSGSPSGTLVFKHRYTAPASGAPFTVAVTGKLGVESQTVSTAVTPRYKVTVSDIEFSPLSHCDTAVEEDTEWHVSRGVRDGNGTLIVPSREWAFDRPTNPRVVVGDWSLPEFEALPDSGFSIELKASDVAYLSLPIRELDPLDDDLMVTFPQDINPLRGSGSVDVVEHEADQDSYQFGCRVEFRYDRDARLLEPGLDGRPVAGQ
jgi:hypothetical protein